MTIKNNPSPFSSITWHQKEPWSCVAYSHCSTNDPHIKWIHSYCFPYNCVTKPLAILQRVIKSQRVLILSYISAKQKSVSFLSETFVVKFLDLIFNFPVSRKSNYQKKKKKKSDTKYQEKMTVLLCPSEKMSPHFTLHMESSSYFGRWVEQHLLSALFLFLFQWYTKEVFMFGMYLIPISIYTLKHTINYI